MKRILAVAGMVMVGAVPAAAQDVLDIAGKWEITRQTPRGEQVTTVTFVQEGTTFTGMAQMGERGEAKIERGKLDGNKITFVLIASFNGRSVEQEYTGTVEGMTAKGTVSGGPGGRGGGAARGGGGGGGGGAGGGGGGNNNWTAKRVQ